MTRSYCEIDYTAPLSTPLKSDAYFAPAEGDWRLIVFPGSPSNKMLFARFLRTAPSSLDVVVLTRPGFAEGHGEAITDFDEQVAAAKPFIADPRWGAKKIITMGVSYGGELALKAALDFPDQVKGVVTVAALIEEPHDYALTLEQMGGEPELAGLVPDHLQKTRAEIAARRDQIGPLLERAKEELQVPVEVLHGDFDAVVPKSNAETLMRYLGDKGRMEIITGGTHYLELQYPRRVHAAVQQAIARAEGISS